MTGTTPRTHGSTLGEDLAGTRAVGRHPSRLTASLTRGVLLSVPVRSAPPAKRGSGNSGPVEPRRLPYSHPVSFKDLSDSIAPCLERGLAKKRYLPGTGGNWAPATVRSAWSATVAAFELLVQEQLPEDERSRPRARHALEHGPAGQDLRALIPLAPEAVTRLRSTVRSAGVSRSQVAMLLRVLVPGWYSDRAPITYRLALLPTAWRELLERVTNDPRAKGSWRNGLAKLAEAASRAGITAPEQLPTDPTALDEWLRTNVTHTAEMHGIRSAAASSVRAGILDLPAFSALPRRNARKRLQAAANVEDELLAGRVPGLAKHIRFWERAVATSGLADATRLARSRVLRRVAAHVIAALDAGVISEAQAAAEMPESWWITPAGSVGPGRSVDFEDPAFTRPVEGGPSVIEAVLLWAARHGRIEGVPLGRLQLPRTVLADLRAFKNTFDDRVKYARELGATLRPEVESLQNRAWAAHSQLVIRLVDNAAGDAPLPTTDTDRRAEPLAVKSKPAAAAMMQLPWVLAFWLPYYTLISLPRAKARLEAIRDRIAKVNALAPGSKRWRPLEHPEEIRALKAYRAELRQWFVLAALFADPIRLKNLHAARVGPSQSQAEVTVDVDWRPDGTLERVKRVSSSFAGRRISAARGHVAASLKQAWKSQRDWDWPRVAVDMGWVREYLSVVWFADLQRRGLVNGLTPEQALATGRFALVTTDGGTQRGRTATPPAKGGYATANSIRALFKQAVYGCFVAMDAAGEGITPFEMPSCAEQLSKVAPYLFSPHITRLVWTCCLMGAMGGLKLRRRLTEGECELHDPIALLCRATTDTQKTLEEEYDATSDRIRQLLARDVDSWRHPRADIELIHLLVSPDASVDFGSLWTQKIQSDGEWIPRALRKPFLDRLEGRDIAIPPIRCKGR